MDNKKNKSENEILSKVEKILMEKFGLKTEIKEELRDIPITSYPFNMAGVDIYRMLMLLEREFSVSIPFSYIKEIGFKTVNQIISVIELSLQSDI